MKSPTLSPATTSINSTVEESIIHVLSSIRYEVERNRYPTESDYEKFKSIHDTLQKIVNEEHNDLKKRKFMAFLPIINNFRLQTLLLRKCIKSCEGIQVNQYLDQFENEIATIHNESFDEINRKILIIIGGVDVIAEIFVLDVKVFGINSNSVNSNIRQLIATVLTNMTFGNKNIKRKLCFHSSFIHTVTKIIEQSHSLSLVYASLIRNLSWKADEEMTKILSETVSALCKSALRAYAAQDLKRLSAALQALWNLSGNSMDNRKSICEHHDFLDLVVNLLTVPPQQATILESASGILSYASIYLGENNQTLAIFEKTKIIQYLFNLLKESSFTIISNSLNALYHLVKKDTEMQLKLLNNQNCMILLNKLRNSNREDIRNVAKKLLNEIHNNSVVAFDAPIPRHLHSPHHSYMSRENEMIASGGSKLYGSQYSDGGRLLPLRSTLLPAPVPMFSSPGRNIMFKSQNDGYMHYNNEFKDPNQFNLMAKSPRCNSLPRHYNNRNNEISINTSKIQSTSVPIKQLSKQLNDLQIGNELNNQEDGTFNDSGESENRLSDSMRCTRTSVISFGTDIQNQSGWESVVSTTENSAPTSPISMRDIPDSPTQCMRQRSPPLQFKLFQSSQGPCSLTPLANEQPTINSNIQLNLIENELEGGDIVKNFRNAVKSNNSNSISGSDCDLQNRTNETVKAQSSNSSHCDIEEDLRIQSGSFLNENNTQLLENSIEAFIPPPRASSSYAELPKNDELLSHVIKETIPKPSTTDDNNHLLMKSIKSAIKNNVTGGTKKDNKMSCEEISNNFCHKSISSHEHYEYNSYTTTCLINSNHSIEHIRSSPLDGDNQCTDIRKSASTNSFIDDITDNTFDYDDDCIDDDDDLDICSDDLNVLPYDIDNYSEEEDDGDIVIDCSQLKKKPIQPVGNNKQNITKGSMIPKIVKPKSKKKVSKDIIKPFMNKSNLSPSARISPFNYKKTESKDVEEESLQKKGSGIIVTTV
uniref:TOG domain-containing protein n=1 Tax=Parastrongyloides trichosuri TaxID=131310 RepID=A0A0N4ZCX8_PARTI